MMRRTKRNSLEKIVCREKVRVWSFIKREGK